MAFNEIWLLEAANVYAKLEAKAKKAHSNRLKDKKKKSFKAEGLFKQIDKTIDFLLSNPRHPSLNTHEFDSLAHPYKQKEKVFEAYAQNKTPAAYRVFWCYGPKKGDITFIAITQHP